MNTKTIGFIGGGRVASILLQGWTHANSLPGLITVSDPKPATLDALKAAFPSIQTTDDNLQAAGQDIVFLGVHPPVLAEVPASIKAALKPDAIVISLAPKFTLTKLESLLGGFSRLVRCIPNAPSVIDLGFNPMSHAPAISVQDKAVITGLLSPLGQCPEVDEAKLEDYALLSAMGPTYFWFQFQALREAAGSFGLNSAEVDAAMKAMIAGSTQTLLDSGLTPSEVMDLVPVKPLPEMERQVTEYYQTRLPALWQKIRP